MRNVGFFFFRLFRPFRTLRRLAFSKWAGRLGLRFFFLGGGERTLGGTWELLGNAGNGWVSSGMEG